MTTWIEAARRGAATGTAAAAASMAALAWRGRIDNGSAAAPLNAPSHWLFGNRALHEDRASLRFTGSGVLTHFVSALLWGVLYERFVARGRARQSLSSQVRDAAVGTAAIAVIDLALIPKRLTPGFERRLTSGSLWLVYGAFAVGICAGSYACRR
jgi:hypothetical protein